MLPTVTPKFPVGSVLGRWWREVATKLAAGVAAPGWLGRRGLRAWRVCCPRRRVAAARPQGAWPLAPVSSRICGDAVRAAARCGKVTGVLPVSPLFPWVCVPGS